MTAQPHGPVPASPQEIRASLARDRSPKALRAALPPEDHNTFDEEYRAALDEARDSYDLSPVQAFQDRWFGIAMLKASPADYQAVMDRAEELQRRAAAGEPLGTILWDDAFEARLRARLDPGA